MPRIGAVRTILDVLSADDEKKLTPSTNHRTSKNSGNGIGEMIVENCLYPKAFVMKHEYCAKIALFIINELTGTSIRLNY